MLNNFKARIGTNLGSYSLDVSTNSIVIGNDFPFNVDKDSFLYIYNKTQSKSLFSINPFTDKITISGNSLLVSGIDCSLGASDLIDIYVSIPTITNSINICSSSNVDDTLSTSIWVGNYEIPVRGFSKLGVFVNYTKGTTIGAQMRIVNIKDTSSSVYFDFENSSEYYKSLDESSSTTYRYYSFDVANLNSVVLQTKAGGSLGTGVITIDVRKSN
jgi:hypothetical protein